MIEIESATFEVTFEEGDEQIAVSFSESDRFDVSFGEGVEKEYRGQYEVTPTEEEQVLHTTARVLTDDVTVDAIPSDYIGSEVPQRTSSDLTASGDTVTAPAGYYGEASSKAVEHGSAKAPEGTVTVNPTVSVDSNGLITATVEKDMVLTPTVVPGYVSSGTSGVLTASGSATRQLSTKAGETIAPTESEQTAVASGKYTTGDVKIGAISSTYVGSDIPQNDSSDLTASGATVTAPAGYYASNASKSVASGSATPASSVSATGATVSTGTNTLTLSKTVSNTPQVSAGYVSSGTAGNTDVSLTASVNTRSSSDLSASGATVTAPAGYYASSASKSVANGTAGTPTASKGAVNNHAISVTPSVTNTTGYITGGTKTGTAVSVSASEVTSGTKSITANDTGIDVTNYAAVDVNVQSSVNLQTITKTYTPSTSAVTDTITPSSGYDGLEEVDVTVSAVPSAYVYPNYYANYITQNNVRKWWVEPNTYVDVAGWVNDGDHVGNKVYYNAIAKNTTITPSTSSQTIGGENYMMEDAVTVSAVPLAEYLTGLDGETYYTDNGNRKWRVRGKTELDTGEGDVEGWLSEGINYGEYVVFNAIAKNTSITPTESSQTIGGADTMLEGAVTVNAIPSNYVGSGITQRTSSDLSASGATVTAPAGYYASSATKTIASGTAGTPTASKGAVNNHAISVTPSVTNTTGYITGSTKTGTAVSVTASELVSGSQTITTNDTYDVTNLASVTVNVSGGGANLTVATATKTLTASASSIQFTGLSGNPTSFVITSSADQTTGGTKAVAVAYDGTNLLGMDITTQMENDTGFTKSYSGGTLTVTATSATFEANEYKLVYTYGGSSSDIHTANVQVGSGATSITFTGLSGRPAYFSCVFKSTFGTSSGYQRVIDVVNDGSNTYGNAMDSSAKAQTSWSYSYSGGSLTITSSGTNNGGYFHQPGYYQLTYAVDSSAPQYESVSKTYRASATAQSETITPSSGYDAIEEVSVSIPAVSQTNLTAANIKSGTTVTISNGQSNLWSVTGTYSGGGGSSKNVQVLQSTSRTNSSSLTKVLGDLTVSKTGTYDIYWSGGRTNTSTSYTWGTRLYVDGSGYGTENTTWTNNCQSNHLSNVSLTANQTLSIYARGRTGSYYTFAPMLVIIES